MRIKAGSEGGKKNMFFASASKNCQNKKVYNVTWHHDLYVLPREDLISLFVQEIVRVCKTYTFCGK